MKNKKLFFTLFLDKVDCYHSLHETKNLEEKICFAWKYLVIVEILIHFDEKKDRKDRKKYETCF